MHRVGFEPTRANTFDLKSNPLDQLGHLCSAENRNCFPKDLFSVVDYLFLFVVLFSFTRPPFCVSIFLTDFILFTLFPALHSHKNILYTLALYLLFYSLTLFLLSLTFLSSLVLVSILSLVFFYCVCVFYFILWYPCFYFCLLHFTQSSNLLLSASYPL